MNVLSDYYTTNTGISCDITKCCTRLSSWSTKTSPPSLTVKFVDEYSIYYQVKWDDFFDGALLDPACLSNADDSFYTVRNVVTIIPSSG